MSGGEHIPTCLPDDADHTLLCSLVESVCRFFQARLTSGGHALQIVSSSFSAVFHFFILAPLPLPTIVWAELLLALLLLLLLLPKTKLSSGSVSVSV